MLVINFLEVRVGNYEVFIVFLQYLLPLVAEFADIGSKIRRLCIGLRIGLKARFFTF